MTNLLSGRWTRSFWFAKQANRAANFEVRVEEYHSREVSIHISPPH